MKSVQFNLILLLVWVGLAAAQPLQGNEYVTAQLVTVEADFDKPFLIGIYFAIAPDWYLYWTNPGDAGLPIQVRWELPDGWSVSPIVHPTPGKFVYGDLVAYGYKSELVLFATITPGGLSRGSRVTAMLDWLVCKESCVKGAARVSIDLERARADVAAQAQATFSRFQRLLPGDEKDSGVSASTVSVQKLDDEMLLAVTLDGNRASMVTDFFPEALDEILIDLSTIKVSGGILSLKFSTLSKQKAVVLRGLFVTPEKAFRGSIPIQLPSS